jgi:hypothetical protein
MARKPTYSFKEGFYKSIPAQVAGEEIERIRKECGEFFQPETIVDAARPEDAPLHPAFEWNDDVAAEEYRKEQARKLINHIIIIEPGKPSDECFRAFVSVQTDAGHRYTSAKYSANVPELRRSIIDQYLNSIEALRVNLARYTELAEATEALQTASKKLRSKRLELA